MIQGKRAIEEFWRAVMAIGANEANLNTVELSMSGDYTYERGTGVLIWRPRSTPGTEQKIKGSSLFFVGRSGTMNLVAGSDEQHDLESLYLEDSFRYQLPPWLILTSFES